MRHAPPSTVPRTGLREPSERYVEVAQCGRRIEDRSRHLRGLPIARGPWHCQRRIGSKAVDPNIHRGRWNQKPSIRLSLRLGNQRGFHRDIPVRQGFQ